MKIIDPLYIIYTVEPGIGIYDHIGHRHISRRRLDLPRAMGEAYMEHCIALPGNLHFIIDIPAGAPKDTIDKVGAEVLRQHRASLQNKIADG